MGIELNVNEPNRSVLRLRYEHLQDVGIFQECYLHCEKPYGTNGNAVESHPQPSGKSTLKFSKIDAQNPPKSSQMTFENQPG